MSKIKQVLNSTHEWFYLVLVSIEQFIKKPFVQRTVTVAFRDVRLLTSYSSNVQRTKRCYFLIFRTYWSFYFLLKTTSTQKGLSPFAMAISGEPIYLHAYANNKNCSTMTIPVLKESGYQWRLVLVQSTHWVVDVRFLEQIRHWVMGVCGCSRSRHCAMGVLYDVCVCFREIIGG